MEPSSTSKVSVTYWDPAALFPLIEPDLNARLPLRNLHWKSPTRPVRSISSLHVDLTPYSPSPSTLSVTSSELTRVKSSDSNRSSAPRRSASRSRAPAPSRKERRHQIPGLRNTPYLKIYILRCDDNDSYKTTQRKLLREWVNTHVTAEGGDSHDAHEWLILHVVLPGTAAAAQPRSVESTATASSGSRWMKGSQTLLDKIRVDFNGSNAKVDRVAQIRIPAGHPALATLSPPVSGTAGVAETPAETETAWGDLIGKMKMQILTSFDARVQRYEEDVRERDSQRALPGWNFCTFFVLKEGLARAFESVGLVEDALVLYDELGFGLEAIVREQEKGEVIGGSFIRWTKEGLHWIEDARRAVKARKEGGGVLPEGEDTQPMISSEKKPYRELILSNEISVFDFRCYLFSRQATLLLRLGRRNGDAADGDDLPRLAEVCARGVDFVTTVARVLRADLNTPRSDTPEDDGIRREELAAVVDNLVASWTFSVCAELLEQTASAALPAGLEEAGGASGVPEVKVLPKRTSSLIAPSFAQAVKNNFTGLEEIAAERAELVVLARTALEGVARRRGLVGREGWFQIVDEALEDVDLHGEEKKEEKKRVWVPEGIRNRILRSAIEPSDGSGFYAVFERLSEKAMKHYALARRFKSAEMVESDLAALKFHLKQYETAAVHLKRMTEFYEEQGWGLIESTLLGMYARCLKEMHKPEEYISVLLKLLKKSAAAEHAHVRRLEGKAEDPDTASLSTHVDVRGYVAEALALSESVPTEITSPMAHLWSNITVDPYPRHLADRDGFDVTIKMRYLLTEPMNVDRITVRIASAPPTPGRELTLETAASVRMTKGVVRATVKTNMTVPGRYLVEQVVVHAGKLRFVHDFSGDAVKPEKLCFFPAPRGLTGRLEMPRDIHLEKLRAVEIVVETGENEILTGEVRIRSATAGLRLLTSALDVLEGPVDVDDDNPGTLALRDIPARTMIRLRLPYKSENELTEMMVRLEVDYATIAGTFWFVETLSVLVALPLAVNVQDIFKDEALYSKFQVSTAAAEVPLRVYTVVLRDSKTFTALGGKGTSGSMTVFAKQPANFTFKVKRREGIPEGERAESLGLVVEYSNMDEELRCTLSHLFTKELEAAGLDVYRHWLLAGLLTRFRHRSPSELETVALLEEFEIGGFDEYGWEDVLEGIDPRSGEREKVEKWLREFFATHANIPLNNPHILPLISRSIQIPVDVPPLHIIHTINLLPSLPPSKIAIVGAPIQAEIVIRHARRWDPVRAGPIEFAYEVKNSPDTWLVGGRKRAHFMGEEGEVVRVGIVLVPAKAGRLALPVVEVVGGGEGVVCECEWRGGAEMVVVGPGVRGVTVRIGE